MSAMKTEPAISVIIPARNAAAFIRETLESLSEQGFNAFEAMVVDDGSTDDTARIAAEFTAEDERIHSIVGPAQGVSAARNAGLAATNAPVVVFLDADDLLLPGSLERFLKRLNETPGASCALGEIRRIAEDGSELPGNSNTVLAGTDGHLEKLLRKNFVVNGGALAIRREAIAKSGTYDPDLSYGEDWEFWCRLAELGDFAIVEGAPVLAYRQVSSGANYRARGSVMAWGLDCINKLYSRQSLRDQLGRKLPRYLRSRRIDIFWSGVRSEFQFGSRFRAFLIAFAGLFVYPDSVLRPSLAIRFVKSLGR